MLLLKAFRFIANFPLSRLSCTIWYVCWLVILELNLWACYSSNDILFLLVLFLPGLDMFYEVLSYSTGIHIWHNQNSISYLIYLQHFKPKYFRSFVWCWSLLWFFFNIWKHFLLNQKLKFVRNRFGSLLNVYLEGREERWPTLVLCPLSPRVPPYSCGGRDEVGVARQRAWFLASALQSTYLISLFCSSEVPPHCPH